MILPEKLKEIQAKALAAVNGMPDGDLKTKAFEVFLQHLLSLETSELQSTKPLKAGKAETAKSKKSSREPGTLKSRILLLKDEGYFEAARTLNEIRDELKAHGWIHPNTAMSGSLQGLVQGRELRRVKEKVWKYVNP